MTSLFSASLRRSPRWHPILRTTLGRFSAHSVVSPPQERVDVQLHGTIVSLVWPQDITASKGDVLINPANAFLCGSSNKDYWMFKGRKNCETRIHEEAGPGLMRELKQLPILNETKMKARVTDVIRTAAPGNLSHFKCILHVVGPRTYNVVNDAHLVELQQTYLNCIQSAMREEGAMTLSMPALGCGIGDIDPRLSAQSFLSALDLALGAEKEGVLDRIEFSFIEKKPFLIFSKLLQQAQ